MTKRPVLTLNGKQLHRVDNSPLTAGDLKRGEVVNIRITGERTVRVCDIIDPRIAARIAAARQKQ